MEYFVYIIETIDNTLYCGIAKDVLKRFEEHKNSSIGAKYTKAHKPKNLVYVGIFEDKINAMKEEYRIKKTLSRKEKIELIEKNKEKTKEILESLKKPVSF